MTVYECIVAVSEELAKTGIAKGRSNKDQGYKFRGIDDVYNALAPVIARHKLVILPRILTRTVTERPTRNGGILFNVVVEAEFEFISAADPTSRHVVRTFGEAMDSADKATNKAMSAAYKYAAFQTFCIPTEGDNDADAHTPEVVAQAPAGFEEWLVDVLAVADEGMERLRAAWKDSKAEYRQHLLDTNQELWTRTKAKAEKVTAKAAAPKPELVRA